MAISKEKQALITEQRKRQIIQAAKELFDRKGFRNTRISEIAAAAGISKGLIYHYYKTKEDILLSMRDELLECVDECAAQEHAVDCLRLFACRLVSIPCYEGYIPPIRLIFSAILQGDLDQKYLDDMLGKDFPERFFGDIVKMGQDEGAFREGDPLRYGMIIWNWLRGCMTEISLHTEENYEPDIEGLLDLLKA